MWTPTKRGQPGTTFHQLLIACSLCVPSKFAPLHRDHATHCGNRIDYIAIPTGFKGATSNATTIRESDPLVTKGEHWPVMLEIYVETATGAYPRSDRLRIDTNKLYDPGKDPLRVWAGAVL